MSTPIETPSSGTIPRGEQSARVELYQLGRRLAAAHDAEVPLAKLMDDVAASWHRANADLGNVEE